ncbi:MAG: hypothetical protein LUH07_04115, partial [Lachnospiraceae bacterium]|nr:hypothetical protein [Lachnospiraceae bacterium]
SVEVREIVAFRYLILAAALLLVVVCDLIAYFLLLDQEFHKEKELGILTLICLAAVIPFVAEYTFLVMILRFTCREFFSLRKNWRTGIISRRSFHRH